MKLEFDHVAVAGETLEVARAHVETSLGLEMKNGGQHAVFHTHNAVMGLSDGLYLEAISVDPSAPAPSRPRWFDLDRFEGRPRLTNWICRTDDIEAAVERFEEAGLPVALQRGEMRWRMAVPASGILPFDNLFPALIQWDVDVTPAALLPASGATLRTLTVSHPWAKALEAMLAPVLEDARIVFDEGPASLSATFATPHGERML